MIFIRVVFLIIYIGDCMADDNSEFMSAPPQAPASSETATTPTLPSQTGLADYVFAMSPTLFQVLASLTPTPSPTPSPTRTASGDVGLAEYAFKMSPLVNPTKSPDSQR